MTPMELKLELERLAEKAKPAAWVAAGEGIQVVDRSRDYSPYVASYVGDDDANLIVGLVNGLPLILRALSALSGLEGVKGADEWQPIETAPKDKPIVGAWWNEPRVAWVARDVFWDKVRSCWACPYEEFYIMPPTHWRPLLTPPARSALLALDNEQT